MQLGIQKSKLFLAAPLDIPWRNVAGFRDVLIHDYMGVDLNAVWQIIENESPALKENVLKKL